LGSIAVATFWTASFDPNMSAWTKLPLLADMVGVALVGWGFADVSPRPRFPASLVR
jgi:hypothetical protein